MSIIEEEFNLIFKKYGGLFNYQKINSTDYIEYMLGVFRDIIQLYAPEEKGLPIPHINIIDNSNLNAVVSKGSLGYHIGFNAGTFFLIKDIFGRMMASPNVLVKFGDTSKEETSKLYNAQITDFNILNLASELPDPVVPENYTRFAISDYLATIALVFLVRHEYAHIIMGHIDYLTGEANTFAIEEKEREITNTKDSFSMLLQTLEMDADSFAVNSATEDIIRLSSSVPSGFTKELIPYLEVKSNLFLHAFAFYALFRLFGSNSYQLEKLDQYSHPPPGLRQNIIFSTFATIFTIKDYVLTPQEVVDICLDAVKSVEDAFVEISDQDFNVSALAFGMLANDHVLKIINNWNNVRPLLEKYATANLAPLKNN